MLFRYLSILSIFLLSTFSFAQVSLAQNNPTLKSLQAQDVISDQLSAFLNGDGPRAFSHAAPSIKKIFQTPKNFMTMVEHGYGPIYRSTTYDFGRSTLNEDQIIQEIILTDQKGNTWQSIYVLKEQSDETLKIMGVQMRPSENTIL